MLSVSVILVPPQFLCVLCVLLLLQAIGLVTALIFENKVNLFVSRVHTPFTYQYITLNDNLLPQSGHYLLTAFSDWHYPFSVFIIMTTSPLCLCPPSILSRRLPCFRAVYEKELNTTTMIWTSKTSWTMCNRRYFDIFCRRDEKKGNVIVRYISYICRQYNDENLNTRMVK